MADKHPVCWTSASSAASSSTASSSATTSTSNLSASGPLTLPVNYSLQLVINRRCYQFFQSPKIAKNLTYARFCEATGLGKRKRKEMGIELSSGACFEFWKQWVSLVSLSSHEFPTAVQEAAQELRIKLLIQVC